MQYFDKNSQRSRIVKRAIGYLAGAIIVVAGTIAMVYAAKGWGIDTKSKQLVLSGLVNLEVRPSDNVKLIIDSDEPKEVSEYNRFTLSSGQHKISLAASGMTPWQKTVEVTGGQISDLPDARLYPLRPLSQTYPGFDKFTSIWSTTDLSKFYIKTPGSSLTNVQFSVYDPKFNYATSTRVYRWI